MRKIVLIWLFLLPLSLFGEKIEGSSLDFGALATPLAGFIFALILFGFFMSRFIKKVPAEEAMDLFRTGRSMQNKYISNGAAIVVPFFHDFRILSLKSMSLPISLKKILVNNNLGVNIDLNATVKIDSNPQMLAKAFEVFAGKTEDEIRANIVNILQALIREIIFGIYIKKSSEGSLEVFNANVLKKFETELAKVGVSVIFINIKNFSEYDVKI